MKAVEVVHRICVQNNGCYCRNHKLNTYQSLWLSCCGSENSPISQNVAPMGCRGPFRPGLFYGSVLAKLPLFHRKRNFIDSLESETLSPWISTWRCHTKGLKSILCFLQHSGNRELLCMEPAASGVLEGPLCAFTVICSEKAVDQGMLSLGAFSLMGVIQICIWKRHCRLGKTRKKKCFNVVIKRSNHES